MIRFYILENKKVKWVSAEEWLAWSGDASNVTNEKRKVAYDEISPGVEISTVFIMGIDHNFMRSISDLSSGSENLPLLFETMVFASEFPEIHHLTKRYPVWPDAENGHAETVAYVKDYLEKLRASSSHADATEL